MFEGLREESIRKLFIEIQPAEEQPGHSHKAADYQINPSALESILVSFAKSFNAESTNKSLAETLRKAAERISKLEEENENR